MMTSFLIIWLFEALRYVARQSYWSLGWNGNRNWQNHEKPEYLLLIWVPANSSSPQFSYPLFAPPRPTQHTLESWPRSGKTGIFWNWQKAHSSAKDPAIIAQPLRGLNFRLQFKSGCHSGWQCNAKVTRFMVMWPINLIYFMLKSYISQLQLFSPSVRFATATTLFSSLYQLGYNFSIISISFFFRRSPTCLNELLQIKQKCLNTSLVDYLQTNAFADLVLE